MPLDSERSPHKARLAVIFVQHERHKYPRALPRLIEAISALHEVEALYVVVDNAKPGDWSHQVSAALFHIGGDNRSWEFSAFDRGARWLESQSWSADLLLFATDALLAYGDEFLQWVDERVIDACLSLSACVGWIDSFMESSKILDLDYDSWIRTSLMFMPVAVEQQLGSLAWPLDDGVLFGHGPEQPFHPDAPISANLQANLLSWLTSEADDGQLDDVWHSQFPLNQETFPRFKDKAKAILREHLLSARLLSLEIPCFDLRAIRQAHSHGLDLGDLRGATGRQRQWLGWRSMSPAAVLDNTAVTSVKGETDAGPMDPVLVLDCGQNPASREFIEQIASEVMPLLWQRFHRARLVLVDDPGSRQMRQLQDSGKIRVVATDDSAADVLAEATVVLVPRPLNDRAAKALRRAAIRGIPAIGQEYPSAGRSEGNVRHYLHAEQPWEIAAACCRLIEDPASRERLGQAAREFATNS